MRGDGGGTRLIWAGLYCGLLPDTRGRGLVKLCPLLGAGAGAGSGGTAATFVTETLAPASLGTGRGAEVQRSAESE